MNPLANQQLPAGTAVRLRKTLLLNWTPGATVLSIPEGTVGVVVEDLNEVVAKENAALRPGSKTDDRPRYLALVRFEEFGKQSWLDYADLEKVEANHG